jgi:hypothetical protein
LVKAIELTRKDQLLPSVSVEWLPVLLGLGESVCHGIKGRGIEAHTAMATVDFIGQLFQEFLKPLLRYRLILPGLSLAARSAQDKIRS